jgi:hypothetical protein
MEQRQRDNLDPYELVTSSQRKGTRGYVTLLVVLVVTILGIAVTFSSLFRGGDTLDAAFKFEQSFEAHSFADACVESGLLAITKEESFSGSDSITFSTGACDYTVESVSDTQSVLQSSGSSGRTIRKVKVVATLEHTVTEMGTTTSITNTRWQEIADF